MQGLLYGVRGDRWTPPDESNHLMVGLSRTPMRLEELERPTPLRDDWAVAKTRLTGICGSDAKMVFMDFGDDFGDSALNGYFTFPTVFGHEVVADVVEVGPAVTHARGRPACRPEPLALVRAPRHRPAVPVVPGRRLQPVLALHPGPDRRGHPHRDVEGRARRLRRLPAGPRVDAHPRPRRPERRGGRHRRPLRRVAALGDPPPATARRQGARLRRRCAGQHGRRPSSRRSTPTSRSWSSPAGPPRPRWPRRLGATVVDPFPVEQLLEEAAAWSGGVLQKFEGSTLPDGAPRRLRRRLRHGRHGADGRDRRPPAQGTAAPWSRAGCTRPSAGSGRRCTSRRSRGWAPTPSGSRRSTACACTASRTTCAWPPRAGST